MDSITSFLQANLAARIFIVLGPVAGLVLVVWWRANSLHSIWERLWRLAAGKGDPHSADLKLLLEETRDIERFRFLYCVKLRSVSDIARFRVWLNNNKVGIFEARQAAQWLDLSRDEILLPPSRRYNIPYFVLTLVCLLLLFLGYLGATSQHGWFQTKVTKVSFLMNKDSVRSQHYPFNDREVPLDTCKAGIEGLKAGFAFSDSEATAICQAYTDQSIAKSVAETVRFQVVFGVLLMLYAIPPLFFAFARMNSVNAAIAISKRIIEAKKRPSA